MNCTKQKLKQTVLATTMAAALGTATIPGQASADILNFNISGLFTLMTPNGTNALLNPDEARTGPWYQYRTPVNGTMTFDTSTNSGTLDIQPFSFFGGGDLVATNITFQDIDGPAGAGTLMLGNMGANWFANIGLPVSIVWDGKGILDAINQGLVTGDTIANTGASFACDTNISCATPATDDFPFEFSFLGTYTLPIGASPFTTTTFDTTDIGTIVPGINPSGTLPLISDTVGGSPMKVGPFSYFNVNFDFDRLTVVASEETGSVSIDVPGGNTQECTGTDGSDISLNVEILIPADDVVDTVSWSLDGIPVASGESAIVSASLGGHTIVVNVTTILGRAFSDTALITVVDTTAPLINVAFLDKKTGAEITTLNSNKKATVSVNVSDTCDASPGSSATAGLPVSDGDMVKARISKKGSDDSDDSDGSGTGLTIKANSDNIKITVTAKDASGNVSNAMTTLKVIE